MSCYLKETNHCPCDMEVLTNGRITERKPYSYKEKRFLRIFKAGYALVFEDCELPLGFASEEQAENICYLLNAAFREGWIARASAERWDENWQGQKLLTSKV